MLCLSPLLPDPPGKTPGAGGLCEHSDSRAGQQTPLTGVSVVAKPGKAAGILPLSVFSLFDLEQMFCVAHVT